MFYIFTDCIKVRGCLAVNSVGLKSCCAKQKLG